MSKLGVRAIIEHDGLYLLVRNKVSPDFWCLPGGGVEPGENILTAMRRELIEELGVEPIIGNLLYIHTMKGTEGYDLPAFFFHIQNGSEYENPDLSKTTHGELELVEVAFKDVTTTHLLPSFLKSELAELTLDGFKNSTRIRLTNFE